MKYHDEAEAANRGHATAEPPAVPQGCRLTRADVVAGLKTYFWSEFSQFHLLECAKTLQTLYEADPVEMRNDAGAAAARAAPVVGLFAGVLIRLAGWPSRREKRRGALDPITPRLVA